MGTPLDQTRAALKDGPDNGRIDGPSPLKDRLKPATHELGKENRPAKFDKDRCAATNGHDGRQLVAGDGYGTGAAGVLVLLA
ncbi:hypothetical protein [Pseudomonas ovata]|uniref:hypothetical protein n=1 Tax=Pseudomonas ovata TaxID=1839709 RepID=UPI00126027AD|nr:hypothetical protein [Pseudomonas ovata]